MCFSRDRGKTTVRHRPVACAMLGTIGVLVFSLALTYGPAPAQAASGCQELIVNGGFENGHEGWEEYSSEHYELIDGLYPHTGTKSVWLGANNNEEDWITQVVALPPDARGLNLRYWWALFTEENPGKAFDFMRVQLLRVDGVVLATLATYSNESGDPWVWNSEAIDVSAYAGQTVKLRFYAKNDGNNPSSFFVDDVSLETCSEANTATPTATTPAPTATPTTSPGPTATPWARIFLPVILK